MGKFTFYYSILATFLLILSMIISTMLINQLQKERQDMRFMQVFCKTRLEKDIRDL